MNPHEDVVGAVELKDLERLVDELLVDLVGEVGVQRAAVDGPLAGAGNDPDPGDGLLATAGGSTGSRGGRLAGSRADRGVLGLGRVFRELGLVDVERDVGRVVSHYWATWVISKGTGFCAAWGWTSPV
ncbi:MAG: hypothetical protein BWY91_02614 [bacterium ADurb.BinA028]|nr:MAG: hypothetical protein BWY91_02614 [bacterium ADurb.BinA028]